VEIQGGWKIMQKGLLCFKQDSMRLFRPVQLFIVVCPGVVKDRYFIIVFLLYFF